jgi:hypothetical protein
MFTKMVVLILPVDLSFYFHPIWGWKKGKFRGDDLLIPGRKIELACKALENIRLGFR